MICDLIYSLLHSCHYYGIGGDQLDDASRCVYRKDELYSACQSIDLGLIVICKCRREKVLTETKKLGQSKGHQRDDSSQSSSKGLSIRGIWAWGSSCRDLGWFWGRDDDWF